MKLPRILILVICLCFLTSNLCVSAINFQRERPLSLGETCVITVPQPEGEIDPGWVYFTQLFDFVPEKDGIYRFLVRYEDDPTNPYDIYMDVVPFCYSDEGGKVYLDNNGYRIVENGCDFDATAGIHYELCFQYPIHDGRYPEFTFYVGTAFDTQVPETGDTGLLLPAMLMLTAAAAVVWLTDHRRKHI